MNTAVHADEQRDGQRERLLQAIVEEAGERGLEQTTIAHVIARAGVSRPTFYGHFSDRQACVLQALRGVQAALLAQIAQAISRQEPQRATHATIVALLEFAEAQPAAARMLLNEALAGGSEVLDARDEGLAATVALIDAAHRSLPDASPLPDLPAELLVGAVHRVLASRLRRGERGLLSLQDDLLAWIDSFQRPIAEHRWSHGRAFPPPARSAFLPEAPLRPPLPLASGRPRRSAGAIAENQRLRIIFATAAVIAERGYSISSVAEIIRAAGVDARVFYSLFSDKQDALMAVHELGFQRTMAVTAGAFFAAEEWPTRIWEAVRAFTQGLDQNPSFSRVGLVEGHAGRPETVQRLEDLMAGFTIFLQEGYQYAASNGRGPSTLGLEAIAAANMELLYRRARADAQVAAQLPAIAYCCLTPFISPGRADQVIDELIAGERDDQPTPTANR
ncbi:MAG TPA: TetR/AcrR family transcriptional regulator [Solirubrobacteraceae bacterium]|nr:TetR/AcrR family transcriptional regulator [Solirubrobacteraceae bacterium]